MTREEQQRRDELIAQLHNGGYSHKEIREAITDNGFPVPGQHALAMIVSRLIAKNVCKKRRPFSDDNKLARAKIKKAIELRMRGEVMREIAGKTGISINTLPRLFRVNKVRSGEKKEIKTVLNSRGKEVA